MKTILFVLMTILCVITARSQGYIGLTRDSLIANHKVFLDDYRVLDFINDDGDTVTVIDGGYYVTIARISRRTHLCNNYNMILSNDDLQISFLKTISVLPMRGDGEWETSDGILISHFGMGKYTIKEYTWTGYTYNFRPTIRYYLNEIIPK